MSKKLIGKTIPVLDHGFVRLVDYMGSDQRIVEAARISYKSPSKGKEQDKKLLFYLWKNKHTSPFEMAKVTLNIKMPIFIMRQYIRHRMQNINETSMRFTEAPSEFYIPTGWRKQDTKNKQGSISEKDFDPVMIDPNSGENYKTATELLEEECKRSYEVYQAMIKAGIAREMARMVLPINIYTEIYTCWDLKNLLHFIQLREDSHAQYEIQEYARAIKEILKKLFPVTIEAFDKYKFVLKED